MGLFKEELHVIENFAKRQGQIYPDACDFGVRLNERERHDLRTAIQDLRRCVPTKPVERAIHGRDTYTKTELFVPFEMDEGLVAGIRVTVEFHGDRKGGFFTIESKRDALTVAQHDSKRL